MNCEKEPLLIVVDTLNSPLKMTKTILIKKTFYNIPWQGGGKPPLTHSFTMLQ